MITISMPVRALAATALLGLANAPAFAQVTQAQQDALRANCRSDFMSKCRGVTPGSADALQCLKKNVVSLSGGCQAAVNAIQPPAAPVAAAPAAPKPAAAPPPAPAPVMVAPAAPPPTAAAPQPAVAAVPPAAPITAAATPTAPKPAPPKAAAAAAPKPAGPTLASAPAATATDAPAMPTAAQQSAILRTCRGDFLRSCKGIQPGGPDALACLQRNQAKLAPDCRTSIMAVADLMPGSGPSPGAISSGAASTPPPAAAVRQPGPPGILPAGRIIKRIKERREQQEQQ